jgi:hypothetical protein
MNDKAIKALIGLYTDAYKDILKSMEDATDFGIANRRAIMADIDKKLARLGVDTDKWIEENVPKQYQMGAADAIGQLRQVGAKIKVGGSLVSIDRKAIEALMSDTSMRFGEAMSGLKRDATRIFVSASQEEIKQQIASGIIEGQTRKQIAGSIKATIRDKGLAALEDKRGRSWTIDRYADMLVRTKMTEARNTGIANKMLQNDQDLVQVSSHGADDICGEWEGEILSLSGATDGFKTVAEAEQDGLFHPNCRHALNVINPSLAAKTEIYQNPYNDMSADEKAEADRAFRNRNDAVTTP